MHGCEHNCIGCTKTTPEARDIRASEKPNMQLVSVLPGCHPQVMFRQYEEKPIVKNDG